MVDDTYRASACAGKEPFKSLARANRAARSQNRRHKVREDGALLEGYACAACGLYHIGHDPSKRQKRIDREKFAELTPEQEAEWKRVENLARTRNRTRVKG